MKSTSVKIKLQEDFGVAEVRSCGIGWCGGAETSRIITSYGLGVMVSRYMRRITERNSNNKGYSYPGVITNYDVSGVGKTIN